MLNVEELNRTSEDPDFALVVLQGVVDHICFLELDQVYCWVLDFLVAK